MAKIFSPHKSIFICFESFPDFSKFFFSKITRPKHNQGSTPHQHLTYVAQLNAIPPNTQLSRPPATQTHPDTRIQVQPHTPNPKSAQNSHTLAAGLFKQRRDPYKNSTNSRALRLSVVKPHTRNQIYCRPPENTYAQPDKRWLSTLVFATKCRRELESR